MHKHTPPPSPPEYNEPIFYNVAPYSPNQLEYVVPTAPPPPVYIPKQKKIQYPTFECPNRANTYAIYTPCEDSTYCFCCNCKKKSSTQKIN